MTAAAFPTVRRPVCEICVYADEHGSWPPDHRGTHCRTAAGRVGCHRSWTGLKEAHCTVGHEHFSTDAHAESHRGPHGTCLPPGGVLRKDGKARMRLTDRGSGPVWVGAERLDPSRFDSGLNGVVGEVADQDQTGSYARTAPRISPTLDRATS